MKKFHAELKKIRSQSSANADDLVERFGVPRNDPPLSYFGMVFNCATSALEHTSHYNNEWAKRSPGGMTPQEIQKTLNENQERIMLLGKTLFIWAMSAAEYNSKMTADLYPDLLELNKDAKGLYLGQIIKASADRGLISEKLRPLWFGANTIRNRLVHNNGYGDADKAWQFTDDLTIEMRDGKMIEGTIMIFPLLTSWLLDAYVEWCEAVLDRIK